MQDRIYSCLQLALNASLVCTLTMRAGRNNLRCAWYTYGLQESYGVAADQQEAALITVIIYRESVLTHILRNGHVYHHMSNLVSSYSCFAVDFVWILP